MLFYYQIIIHIFIRFNILSNSVEINQPKFFFLLNYKQFFCIILHFNLVHSLLFISTMRDMCHEIFYSYNLYVDTLLHFYCYNFYLYRQNMLYFFANILIKRFFIYLVFLSFLYLYYSTILEQDFIKHNICFIMICPLIKNLKMVTCKTFLFAILYFILNNRYKKKSYNF